MGTTGMEFYATHDDDVPNVVRLEIPSDHRSDGAAWVYVPSKDTIYIGPPGSYDDGGLVDLAATVKKFVDQKKDEKPVTGVLYNDGFVDYFRDPQGDEDRLVEALQQYHEVYYGGNGAFANQGYKKNWDNYPTEDDSAFDPEDERESDDDDPIYDPDTGQLIGYLPASGENKHDAIDDTTWQTLRGKDYSSDYSVMKNTQGTKKPISEWTPQDHLDWRDRADKRRGKDSEESYGWYGGWGAPREDLHHFRWSFGDSNLVKNPPHEGLWLWPTEGGYPDHYSQTGSDGLGNCAQGRVYPHFNNKWEILTWPERPTHVHDPLIKDAIKREAEAAVKQYLIEKIGVKPEDIFFTEMDYGRAVSNYDSPAYPRTQRGVNGTTPGLNRGSEDFDWDTGSNYDKVHGDYPDYNDPLPPGHWDSAKQKWIPRDDDQLNFDENGDANYRTPSFFGDSPDILKKVVDKIKDQWHEHTDKSEAPYGDTFTDAADVTWQYDHKLKKYVPADSTAGDLTPEQKWEQALQNHEQEQKKTLPAPAMKKVDTDNGGMEYDPLTKRWYPLDPEWDKWNHVPVSSGEPEAPEGTSRVPTDDTNYVIHKQDGKITVVDEDSYDRAVEQYGPENWWYAFVGPTEPVESIEKKTADIHDYDPENPGQLLDAITQGQPTGQRSYWNKNDNDGVTKVEAFVWLGVGYGDDTGEGDPKDAELITGLAHWSIVNRLIGKSIENIGQFLDHAENGDFKIPMVWGWSYRHPLIPGVYVKFLSHLMGHTEKQDLQFVPQALAAIAQHYDQPIEGWNIEDSETPIMQHFPVSGDSGGGGSPPDPGLATAPTPSGAGQQSVDLTIPKKNDRVISQDTVGFITITTYDLGKGTLYETEIQGGELDGHVFPSHSLTEAQRMHDLLVRDEQLQQRTSSVTVKIDQELLDLKPDWKYPFAYSPDVANKNNLVLAYSPQQLIATLQQQGIDTSNVILGKTGSLLSQWVYDTHTSLDEKVAKQLEESLQNQFGWQQMPWQEIKAQIKEGGFHPVLFPAHACFGYINHHLVIGQKHHQEIMYRFLENGWTWEQLLSAPQVWGWFSKTSYKATEGEMAIWFSSDAGTMTDDNLKKEVISKIGMMSGMPVKDTGGYGGKDKKSYGGNIKSKYGDPSKGFDEMDGNYTKLNNTLLTPVPPPPVEDTESEGNPVVEALVPNLDPVLARKKKVKYHGLHHPHVLRHVFMYHDWFERHCPPAAGDNDNDNDDPPADLAPTTEPVSPQ